MLQEQCKKCKRKSYRNGMCYADNRTQGKSVSETVYCWAALLAASEYPSDEYPKVIDPEGGEHEMYDFTALMDMFKAGAEWQAEQGVTIKGMQYGGNLAIPDAIPESFYTDSVEEVIVQIRKK